MEPELAHIVNTWLNGNSIIKDDLTFRGCNKLRHFKKLVLNEIASIKNRSVTPEVDIDDDLKEELLAVLSYLNQLQINEGPASEIGLIDHTLKTREDFQAFFNCNIPFVTYSEAAAQDAKRQRELHAVNLAAAANPPTSSSTGSGASTTSGTPTNANHGSSAGSGGVTQSDVADFRKQLKVDVNSFPSLKNAKGWVVFSRDFKVDCDAFNLSNTIDPTYVPTAGHATTLFNERNRLLFKILKDKVLTVKGKSIIKTHMDQRDGQRAWKELTDFYEGPGSLERKSYLNQLSTKIHTPLRSTDLIGVNLHDKLVQWDGYVSEYCDVKGTTMTSDERLTLMETFLVNVPSLRKIEEDVVINTALRSGSTTANSPDVSIELYHTLAQLADMRKKEQVLKRRTAMVSDLLRFNQLSHNTIESPFVDSDLPDDDFYQVMQSEMKRL